MPQVHPGHCQPKHPLAVPDCEVSQQEQLGMLLRQAGQLKAEMLFALVQLLKCKTIRNNYQNHV